MLKSQGRATAFLLCFIKGALIGTGAILPGVSGGVLCVAMGIYEPMMAMLVHPISELRKRYTFFLPILIGFAAGVLGLSRLVELFFRDSPVPITWLFIGLIAGSLPEIWQSAGMKGRSAKHIFLALGCFLALYGGMLALKSTPATQLTPNVYIWLLCGVLWAIGLILPGLSPSALFIFFGIYPSMAAGIAALSFSILIPMGLGFLIALALLSRALTRLFHAAYAYAMHAILGITLAGAVGIIPSGADISARATILCVLCFLIGFSISLAMKKQNDQIPESGETK